MFHFYGDTTYISLDPAVIALSSDLIFEQIRSREYLQWYYLILVAFTSLCLFNVYIYRALPFLLRDIFPWVYGCSLCALFCFGFRLRYGQLTPTCNANNLII